MSKHLPITKTCQKCGKGHETTKMREVYTKDYTGPCSDSFCYASCEDTTCRPLRAYLCEPCKEALERKPTEGKTTR